MKNIKKNSLLFISLILLNIPAFAENWIQLETGLFVDSDSLTKYYLPNNNNTYSIWTKSYNDGSENFYPDEDYFNNLFIINCDNAKSTIKAGKTYYKDGHSELKVEMANDHLKWMNINPRSKGEVLYAYVCQPNIKKTEQNSVENNYAINSSDIYKQNVKSMLFIETQLGTGSGVILNSDGTFVTCFHVIAGADYIKVKTADGYEYYVNGFKYINPLADVAILTINNQNRTFHPIKLSYTKSEIGEKIYTISNPRGLEFTFSDGMISRLSNENIQFSAPTSSGSSGGALLNKKGELLGIITSGIPDAQNISFALPNEYYLSKIYNPTIKNNKNEKWTDFIVNNANEDQFKLMASYAINHENYLLLYKCLKPMALRKDFPVDLYALIGYIAFNAYLNYDEKEAIKDAIEWYENSLSYNQHEEVSSLALILLYIINDKKGTKFNNVAEIIQKYPDSFKYIQALMYCNENDDKCIADAAINMGIRIDDLTAKIYWNNGKYNGN